MLLKEKCVGMGSGCMQFLLLPTYQYSLSVLTFISVVKFQVN